MSVPKPPKIPPPPPPPVKADASVTEAGMREPVYSSYVSTGNATGLQRKAKTAKTSLIGGA